MWRMANPRMDYSWGSTTSIPDFLGEEPTGEPVAELWIGAHPKAPSTLLGFDGANVPLDQALRDRPELLGDEVAARYGSLPFLVKLLAAGGPLSLQVHPSEATAQEGFAREEAEGIALDAGNRTYKDAHHKPETMIALTNTETLAGFRSADEARSLLRELGLPWADAVAEFLDDADMAPAFAALLDKDAWADARETVLRRCAELADSRAFALIIELDAAFPHDSGAAAPLLLNVANYGVGEALFVPTGEIHAHINGFGIEVMAASDNVIRAGLTPKYVDVEALFGSLIATPNPPHLRELSKKMTFPVDEFAVAVVADEDVLGSGPRVVLAHDGACQLALGDGTLELRQGQSVFVPDGEAPRLRGRALVVSTAG